MSANKHSAATEEPGDRDADAERPAAGAADLDRHRRRVPARQHRAGPAAFEEPGPGPEDPVLIQSNDDPWDWSEVRGHVVETVGGPEARQHIDELSKRYVGTEYSAPIGPQGRVIFKIVPDKVNTAKS
jgi:hypothetical protein